MFKSNPIYSTPAQVREIITIAIRLGIEAKSVQVQYSGGAWDTKATLPVQLPPEAENAGPDIYSIRFENETNDCNVASTLQQIKAMEMPVIYRAWYVWLQITGRVVSLDEFTARLTEKVLAPELEKILGGK